MHCTKYILDLFFSSPGTCLNIHEDERMKPENWIPLGWLPIVDNERSLRERWIRWFGSKKTAGAALQAAGTTRWQRWENVSVICNLSTKCLLSTC